MHQTIAWDTSGRTGPLYAPEDPASRPPANTSLLLAGRPALIRYRASWEIVPTSAGTPPQLRIRTRERIVGPKSAYREAAARFQRGEIEAEPVTALTATAARLEQRYEPGAARDH